MATRPRVAGVLSICVAMCFAVIGFSAPAAAAEPAAAWPQHPDDDPFYAQPDPMPDVPPGTVLDSRQVRVRALAIPVPFTAWQVKYLSTDTHGEPSTNVATIIQPLRQPPSGQRTLVSYQTAYDGLSGDCAPSYALTTGLATPAFEEAAMLPMLLAGHTVVTADYEGPEYQWAAGINSGHGVLDGIRAAQSFPPAGLQGPRTPTVMWGYSGGALASQWANELQPTYAPELNILGVAIGGVPANVERIARAIDGGPLSGVYLGAAVGLSRAYPEIDTATLLNDRGKAMFADIGDQCIGTFTVEYAFRSMSEFTTVPELLDVPAVRRVIAENTMGQRVPGAPTYIYQGTHDELTITPPVDELVDTYCAAGSSVQYRKIFGEHITTAGTGVPGALAYLANRFAGKPAPSNC